MSKRRSVVAGNWKMNKTVREARELVRGLAKEVGAVTEPTVVLCPPFTSLFAVKEEVESTQIKVGAQNVHWEPSGAFTGAISVPMLVDLGCEYAIVGHSERRIHFRETGEEIGRKLKSVLAADLIPIFCVGERLEERERGSTQAVLTEQLRQSLRVVEMHERLGELVIAYEPVWAIGTGKTAGPDVANEAHGFIRKFITREFGFGSMTPILYGGSVTPENAQSLMEQDEVDGVLVGGASLKVDSFSKIVRSGVAAKLR